MQWAPLWVPAQHREVLLHLIFSLAEPCLRLRMAALFTHYIHKLPSLMVILILRKTWNCIITALYVTTPFTDSLIRTDALDRQGLRQYSSFSFYFTKFRLLTSASNSHACSPGINRISLKLQPRPSPAASAPVPTGQDTLPNPPWPEQLFDENSMPLPSVHRPLLDTFFRTMSQHFPSISRKRMDERLETGTMSAFFMNCKQPTITCFLPFPRAVLIFGRYIGICAVAAR